MCGGGGSPPVQPYVAPPKQGDPAVQEAIRKEKELAIKRKGRQSTILTSSQGLGDSGTGKKTLLGQ